jgi:hypothetical protein
MGKFISEIFSDVTCTFSSKRFITIISVFLFVFCVISQVWFQKTVDHDIFNSIRDIVVSGTGFIGMEQITNIFNPSMKSPDMQ